MLQCFQNAGQSRDFYPETSCNGCLIVALINVFVLVVILRPEFFLKVLSNMKIKNSVV